MSNKDAKAGSGPVADEQPSGFLDQNWNERLKEAREKRAKNLSKPRKTPRSKPSKAAQAGIGLQLSGATAIKALFLFAGSAGFGLGAVLGIGILIGWGQSDRTPTQNLLTFGPTEPATSETVLERPDQTANFDAVLPVETSDAIQETTAQVKDLAEQPEPPVSESIVVTSTDVAATEDVASLTEALATEQINEVETIALADEPRIPEQNVTDQDVTVPESAVVLEPSPLLAPVVSPRLATSPVEMARGTVRTTAEDVTLFSDRLVNSLASNVRGLPEVEARPDDFAAEPAVVAKVFIHAPDGVGKSKLQSMSSKVEATGVEVAGVGRERFRVSTTHLRYYSPETEQAATALAADLGVSARDFSQDVVIPGRIELWVAGQPRNRVVAKKRVRSPKPEKKNLFSWLRRNTVSR